MDLAFLSDTPILPYSDTSVLETAVKNRPVFRAKSRTTRSSSLGPSGDHGSTALPAVKPKGHFSGGEYQ